MTAERRFLALGVAAAAFALAFIYPSIASEPVAWYYPTAHRWAFEVKPTGLAMDFYGRVAQALVAWLLAFAGTSALVRRLRTISARAIGLITAWALTAIIFAMLFYAWTLHYRVPTPAPLPADASAQIRPRQ